MKNNMSLLFITLILYVMSFACWFNFISSFSFVQLCVYVAWMYVVSLVWHGNDKLITVSINILIKRRKIQKEQKYFLSVQ